MKLTLKRVLKEDLAKTKEDIPKYVDAILKVLNSNFEQLGSALSNKLSFEDNFNCTVMSRDVTHEVELEINPLAGKTGNLRVIGVLLTDAAGLVVDKFGWTAKTNGNIGVTVSFDGGTADTSAGCKIVALLA